MSPLFPTDKQDARLAEALVNYQLILLKSLSNLTDQIEHTDEDEQHPHSHGDPAIEELTTRLNGFETMETQLRLAVEGIASDLQTFELSWNEMATEQAPLYSYIMRAAGALRRVSGRKSGQESRDQNGLVSDEDDLEWAWMAYPIGGLALVVLAISGWRRWDRIHPGGFEKKVSKAF